MALKLAKPTSLGGRIVLATLVFCLFFTLLVAAVRTWSAWQSNVARMSGEMALIAQVYQQTLAKSIWEMDRDSLQTHLNSMANAASVGQVVVSLHSANRAPEVLQRAREGWQPSTLAPVLNLPLDFQLFAGSKEAVGALTLYGDERVLWAWLRNEMSQIIATQITQSLLLASLIMLLLNRLVTVHVRRIAQHLGQLTPANLRQRLALNRPSAQQDELAQLVGGVNQLQTKLSDYLEQQQRDEIELLAHRDNLAQLVRERTAELEAANLRLEDSNSQLESLARTDPLTGLANRRQFDEMKEIEFRRALRTGHPLTLLVCDIDCFKHYNDTYGHASGDQCLRAVATALSTGSARAGDLVARIGGEEFAVLLPATDATQAALLATQLLRGVSNLDIAHGNSEAAAVVTISIGLAQLEPTQVDKFDTLFNQADKALYLAKRAGRNRVVVHGKTAAQTPATPISIQHDRNPA
ncbi:MAG: diguanylate cyclase [Ferruginibacter sp.]|nr:diguanylate cyclase [Rhodoferax sp.]